MKVRWIDGPPPDRGHWWIVWNGAVHAVSIDGALINPDGEPLIKTLGGMAYNFAANRARITKHAPLIYPEPPR